MRCPRHRPHILGLTAALHAVQGRKGTVGRPSGVPPMRALPVALLCLCARSFPCCVLLLRCILCVLVLLCRVLCDVAGGAVVFSFAAKKKGAAARHSGTSRTRTRERDRYRQNAENRCTTRRIAPPRTPILHALLPSLPPLPSRFQAPREHAARLPLIRLASI